MRCTVRLLLFGCIVVYDYVTIRKRILCRVVCVLVCVWCCVNRFYRRRNYFLRLNSSRLRLCETKCVHKHARHTCGIGWRCHSAQQTCQPSFGFLFFCCLVWSLILLGQNSTQMILIGSTTLISTMALHFRSRQPYSEKNLTEFLRLVCNHKSPSLQHTTHEMIKCRTKKTKSTKKQKKIVEKYKDCIHTTSFVYFWFSALLRSPLFSDLSFSALFSFIRSFCFVHTAQCSQLTLFGWGRPHATLSFIYFQRLLSLAVAWVFRWSHAYVLTMT